MNIAIFSPNKNPYSETFIQAHKNGLPGNVFYFYGLYYDDIKLEAPAESYNTISLGQRISNKLGKGSITEFRKKNLLAGLKKHNISVALVEYGQHAHRLVDLFVAANVPFVVHFHGHDATEHHILKNTDNYTNVFLHAAAVIAVSTFMEKHLLAIGCPREKLFYNVYGPRPEFAAIQAQQNKPQFLSVGRFTNKKAPYYTILAFAAVLKNYPEARLVLAGNGVLMESCINLVRHLKIESAVEFAGVVSAEQISSYLQESIAYVQHSITSASGDMEGTPLSILEASSAGLPVISTFHAGIPDVILHEKTGLLCQEHDVASMTKHMELVLKDNAFAKKLGSNAKQRIQDNYTLSRHLEKLAEILEFAANK